MGMFKNTPNQDKVPEQPDKPKRSTALVMLFNTLPKLGVT